MFSKVTIEEPIVLHEGDIINAQDLIEEIVFLSRLNCAYSNSVYVYSLGRTFPDSYGSHYYKADKIKTYLEKYKLWYGNTGKVILNKNKFSLEKP